MIEGVFRLCVALMEMSVSGGAFLMWHNFLQQLYLGAVCCCPWDGCCRARRTHVECGKCKSLRLDAGRGCREVHAAERSNLIIAIGDLTFRYPNLLEPWTAHIYKPLSDPDQGARRKALGRQHHHAANSSTIPALSCQSHYFLPAAPCRSRSALPLLAMADPSVHPFINCLAWQGDRLCQMTLQQTHFPGDGLWVGGDVEWVLAMRAHKNCLLVLLSHMVLNEHWDAGVRLAAGVRKNCLMVLSHLILNDMMKVKGHIARLALCLQDDEPRVAGLAQVFFHELSAKASKVRMRLPPFRV